MPVSCRTPLQCGVCDSSTSMPAPKLTKMTTYFDHCPPWPSNHLSSQAQLADSKMPVSCRAPLNYGVCDTTISMPAPKLTKTTTYFNHCPPWPSNHLSSQAELAESKMIFSCRTPLNYGVCDTSSSKPTTKSAENDHRIKTTHHG